MAVEINHEALFSNIVRRYGGADPFAFQSILCPALIPIRTLDNTIIRLEGQAHYRASFTVKIDEYNEEILVPGRTGKFVPRGFYHGEPWRELAKGRILSVDHTQGIAYGEVYVGSKLPELRAALQELTPDDYLEIDTYGAAAKVLSGLVELTLSQMARDAGYKVYRMPEDCAQHVGDYYYYDFRFEKDGVAKRIEVKSLWGTDTRYARLIHSKSKNHETSSPRFDTQDIFAVSLFLRTGNIRDFAFARSVPNDEAVYGLPRARKFPEYLNQNPLCTVGDGSWFASIDEVWDLP